MEKEGEEGVKLFWALIRIPYKGTLNISEDMAERERGDLG